MWLTSITCSIAVQEEIAALAARLASLAAEKEAAERRAAEAAGAMAAAQQMWQVAEELHAREAELKAVAQERSALAAQASLMGGLGGRGSCGSHAVQHAGPVVGQPGRAHHQLTSKKWPPAAAPLCR